MVRLWSETASPASVITTTRPEEAPAEAIVETGITRVVPSPDVVETFLLRENLTVIDPVNPVPVIVKLPPEPKERVKVENPVIEGGTTVEVSNDVTPLSAIVEPDPT